MISERAMRHALAVAAAVWFAAYAGLGLSGPVAFLAMMTALAGAAILLRLL